MRGPYHALWPPLASPFADRARSGPDPPPEAWGPGGATSFLRPQPGLHMERQHLEMRLQRKRGDPPRLYQGGEIPVEANQEQDTAGGLNNNNDEFNIRCFSESGFYPLLQMRKCPIPYKSHLRA